MATKFLEPGGDADFGVGTTTGFSTNGFWDSFNGTAVATDFVHGTHVKSLKYRAGQTDVVSTANGSLSDTGSRFSWYVYLVALPTTSKASIFNIFNAGSAVVNLYLTTAGVLQLWNGSTAQIGTDGATLSTGQWYRISIAYTITSTSVNRFELFVHNATDGALTGISVTNATLALTGTTFLRLGNQNTNAGLDFRSSDHYIDDSSALTDTGNIWVTAKRPNANGTAVEFTTQVGASGSGYGSGHSPQVNERPLSVTNGWSINTTTKKTEEYSIESAATGDINISGFPVIDYMGWILANVNSTANSPVHNIIVGGVATSKTMSTTTKIYTKIAGSTTYPAGNTDIGMDAQYTTTAHITNLYECGVIVAYKTSLEISVIDSITLTESVTGFKVPYNINVVDFITVNEFNLVTRDFITVDFINISENITLFFPLLVLGVSDSIGISESSGFTSFRTSNSLERPDGRLGITP